MANILISGYGVVGKNLRKELSNLQPDIYDKYLPGSSNCRKKQYALNFVCVPTPYVNANDPCNLDEVRDALYAHEAELYILKSTVLPGTTEKLCAETKKNIIFSPEYYGSTQHANNFSFDFTILGGNRELCNQAIQFLQQCYDARHHFYATTSKTAELVKYMENAYLAAKVSFCVQFWELAHKIGVDYSELRELFILDPRINASHTFVSETRPYWDSHCLNKDVPAITETYDADMLKGIIAYNEQQKAKYQSHF